MCFAEGGQEGIAFINESVKYERDKPLILRLLILV